MRNNTNTDIILEIVHTVRTDDNVSGRLSMLKTIWKRYCMYSKWQLRNTVLYDHLQDQKSFFFNLPFQFLTWYDWTMLHDAF